MPTTAPADPNPATSMSSAHHQTEQGAEPAACTPSNPLPQTPKRTAMPTLTLRTPRENLSAHRLRGNAPRRVPQMNFRIIPLSLTNTAVPPTVSTDEESTHINIESPDDVIAETSARLTLPHIEPTTPADPRTRPGSFEVPSPQLSVRSPLQSIAALRSARESKQRYRQRGLTPRKVSAANSLQLGTVRDLMTGVPAPVFRLGDLTREEPEDAVCTDLSLSIATSMESEALTPSAETTAPATNDRTAPLAVTALAETSTNVPGLKGTRNAMKPEDETNLSSIVPTGTRPLNQAERDRRDRRFFRDRGTPRKVQNAGFKIQPMARPSKGSADIEKGKTALQKR